MRNTVYKVSCPKCKGTGRKTVGFYTHDCGVCEGSGKILMDDFIDFCWSKHDDREEMKNIDRFWRWVKRMTDAGHKVRPVYKPRIH